MGSWGYNLYENDKSCDVRDHFMWLTKKNPDMPAWKILDELVVKEFEDQINHIDVVLAFVDLTITFSKLTPVLLDKALKSINKEIGEVERWDNPSKRMKFLMDYEDYIKTTVTNK